MAFVYTDAIPVPASGDYGGFNYLPITNTPDGSLAENTSGLDGHIGYYKVTYNPNSPPEGFTERGVIFTAPNTPFAKIRVFCGMESGEDLLATFWIASTINPTLPPIQHPLSVFDAGISDTTFLLTIPDGYDFFYVGVSGNMQTQQSEYYIGASILAIQPPSLESLTYRLGGAISQPSQGD